MIYTIIQDRIMIGYNSIMAYMPTNLFPFKGVGNQSHLLLAFLHSLFTIHSKLPALKCYSNTFFYYSNLTFYSLISKKNDLHFLSKLLCCQFEDDLVQFWCGNMVKLAAMILCIGYLAYEMDLE